MPVRLRNGPARPVERSGRPPCRACARWPQPTQWNFSCVGRSEAAPAWLAPLIEPEWAKRYGRRVEIGKLPGGKAAVTARAAEFGRDGQKILTAAWSTGTPPHLRLLLQVEILRQPGGVHSRGMPEASGCG
jgi:hypothetical protein